MFWYPDPRGTPESLLIERESDPLAFPTDRDARADRLRALIDRLPPDESQTLALSLAGDTQQAIGDALGVRQSTVSYRLGRALQRLLWLNGEGSWFEAEDIARDVGPHLERAPVRALSVWWGSGCRMRVAEALRIPHHRASLILSESIQRLRASAAVDPKYPIGFLALWQAGEILSVSRGKWRARR